PTLELRLLPGTRLLRDCEWTTTLPVLCGVVGHRFHPKTRTPESCLQDCTPAPVRVPLSSGRGANIAPTKLVTTSKLASSIFQHIIDKVNYICANNQGL